MRSPILQKTSAIAQEEIFTPGSCLSYIVPARWLEWSGAESCLESSQPSHAKNSVPFLPRLFFFLRAFIQTDSYVLSSGDEGVS